MKFDIRLSPDDMKSKHENALDLFYSGIKSAEGRRTMDGNLKKFLVESCADIFHGDYKQRVQEFVEFVKEDQDKATSLLIAYVRRLRERTVLDKKDPSYLNPSTLPNKVKPIKKLLEMNSLGLGWKRIYALYPEKNNTNKGRGYTTEELQKMLEHSDSVETSFVIMATSSGGFRLGAWDKQIWGNVFPIYETNGKYVIDLPENEIKESRVVCGAMIIYKDTEEYISLISIEAWNKLQVYKKIWTDRMKRSPTDSDPLLLERYLDMTPMTIIGIARRIEKILVKAGLRTPLVESKRRHDVPLTNGFRRRWDKIMMEKIKNRDTLSILVLKERLMGHKGLINTDKNYYWTDILDSIPEYLKAMPYLMITEDNRLRQTLESSREENKKLLKANVEKEEALRRLVELEAKVERMQKYHIRK
jgi:hypothetical protein